MSQTKYYYGLYEIDRKLHSPERWYEIATTPIGETHVADKLSSGNLAFSMDAGNNDWGAWIQILGTNDTPYEPGMTMFSFAQFHILSAERQFTYYIQLAFGEDADVAKTNYNYTEFLYTPQTIIIDAGSQHVFSDRYEIGTKVWARTKCVTQNTGYLNFQFGIQEYLN